MVYAISLSPRKFCMPLAFVCGLSAMRERSTPFVTLHSISTRSRT